MTSAASPTTRSATATFGKALNITLWVLQVLLACFFVMVGNSHALMPFDQIAQQATWIMTCHAGSACSLAMPKSRVGWDSSFRRRLA